MATRRPPALKHGLTSRYAREQWSEDVLRLAEALIGETPREPPVVEAAREAAEAILYLRLVQRAKLHVLEGGTLRRATPTDTGRELALSLSTAVKRGTAAECASLSDKLRVTHDVEWKLDMQSTATIILGLEVGDRSKELRRVNEYERRALSQRRSALRRLDYERVEAGRRVASGKARRASGALT
jgi:hypothetical protein